MNLELFNWGHVIKMLKNKKSQFVVLTGFVFLLLVLFIYSQETENTYINNNGKYHLIENIKHESCLIGKKSNASYIVSRFDDFTSKVSSYCSNYGYYCMLNISFKPSMPPGGNPDLANYTQFNYQIIYGFDGLNTTTNFTC